MNKFLKWISGQEASERGWRSQPRQLPHDLPYAPDDFVVSRELYCLDKPYVRQYAAAVYNAKENYWKPMTYTVKGEGKLEGIEGCYMDDSAYYNQNLETPADVVAFLQSWEKYDHYVVNQSSNVIHFETCKWGKIPDTDETYSDFALRRGVHFDAKGCPYMPTVKDVKTNKILLSGKSLSSVFSGEPPFKGWGGLGKSLEKDFSFLCYGDGINDRYDAGRLDFYFFREFHEKMKGNTAFPKTQARVIVECLAFNNDFVNPFVGGWELYDATDRLINISKLYMLLDSGAAFYEQLQAKGASDAIHVLSSLKNISAAAEIFATQTLDMTPSQTAMFKDVIMAGRYPQAALPIERFCVRNRGLIQEAYENAQDRKLSDSVMIGWRVAGDQYPPAPPPPSP